MDRPSDDFRLGFDTAAEVLAAVPDADRDDFIEDELSDTGMDRGREISEQSEMFNQGWEHALRQAREARAALRAL